MLSRAKNHTIYPCRLSWILRWKQGTKRM